MVRDILRQVICDTIWDSLKRQTGHERNRWTGCFVSREMGRIDGYFDLETVADDIAEAITAKVNRLVVVENIGRTFDEEDVRIRILLQDGGQTLKVFMVDRYKHA